MASDSNRRHAQEAGLPAVRPAQLRADRRQGPRALRTPLRASALLTHIEGHLSKPGEPELARRRRRYVNNPTAHEGTTIVDGHNHRTSIALIRDLHLRAERQRAVGRSERFAI